MAERPLEAARCFVRGNRGAIVREGASLESRIVVELPSRCVVVAEAVAAHPKGARVRIISPLAGWVSFKCLEVCPVLPPEILEWEACPEPSLDLPATFDGFRRGHFFGTVGGKTGYHPDPEARPQRQAASGVYEVTGVLGARVRAEPELYSPVREILEPGTSARICETADVRRFEEATPGDPWGRVSLALRDTVVGRAHIRGVGWVSSSVLTRRREVAARSEPAPAAEPARAANRLVSTGRFERRLRDAAVPPPPTKSSSSSSSSSCSRRDDVAGWLSKKAELGQDACLIGDSKSARGFAVRLCEALGREIEYVSLSRDTVEADLTQRRELRAGRTIEWTDQPAARAARHGRVLILDGIDRAERNLLPLLNNLLENRELALEDGVLRAAPGFFVVATCVDARGLDPPLRSRFVGARVPDPDPDPDPPTTDLPVAVPELSSSSLTPQQQAVAGRLARDLARGRDACLRGPSGVGKTACVAAICRDPLVVMCHGDLAARDLLQVRVFDEELGTTWRDAPAVEAARTGTTVVLDGVDRLPAGILGAALGPLLEDRRLLSLPDGSRLEAAAPGFRAILVGDTPDKISGLARHSLGLLDERDSRFLVAGSPHIEAFAALNLELGPGELVRAAALSVSEGFEAAVCRVAAPFSPDPARVSRLAATARRQAGGLLQERDFCRAGARAPEISITATHVRIADVEAPRRQQQPSASFSRRSARPPSLASWVLRDALLEWTRGWDLQLAGRPGVGKNVIADKLLELLNWDREYVQLHADSTVSSLLSALSRAERSDRCLVVDEADKAPAAVLRALENRRTRAIILANRPVAALWSFATLLVENLETSAEIDLLESLDLPPRLALEFAALRNTKPYSTRELLKVARHAARFPEEDNDDDDRAALRNVLAFDAQFPALELDLEFGDAVTWLRQKQVLGQDAYLLCDPGPAGRRLAKKVFAGAEVVTLSPDSTASDLFQRREIRDGRVARTDLAFVRAAREGRVLILEGIERAEPALLPILNNLLENRETTLDDGRTLVAAPGFLVVAVGPPTPKHRGHLLDPSLRSRFCAHVLPPASKADLVASVFRGTSDASDAAVDVAKFVAELRRRWEPTAPPAESLPKWRVEEIMRARAVEARLWPPETAVETVAKLLRLFPAISPAAALARAYPINIFPNLLALEARADLDALLADYGLLLPPVGLPTGFAFETTPRCRVDDEQPDASIVGAAFRQSLDADGLPIKKETITTTKSDDDDDDDNSGLPTVPRGDEESLDAGSGLPIEKEKKTMTATKSGLPTTPRDDDDDEESLDADGLPIKKETITTTTTKSDDDDDSGLPTVPRDDDEESLDADGLPIVKETLTTTTKSDDDDDSGLPTVPRDDDEESLDADGLPIKKETITTTTTKSDDDDDSGLPTVPRGDEESLDAGSGLPIENMKKNRDDAPSEELSRDDDNSLDADGLPIINNSSSGETVGTKKEARDSSSSSSSLEKMNPGLGRRVDANNRAPSSDQQDEVDADGLVPAQESSEAYVLRSVEATGRPGSRRLRFETRDGRTAVAIARGGEVAARRAPARLSGTQRVVLAGLLQDHCCGVDSCVVGERGAGKSLVVREMAAVLGLRARTVACYRDLSFGDLLMRRATDERGDTTWRRGPVVEAAIGGRIAVLDGVHRLAPGVLASLASLLTDRDISLPDGTRLERPHPAFRVVATAESGWLPEESVVGLFHFHALAPLTSREQATLVSEAAAAAATEADVAALASYGEAVRAAVETTEAAALEPLVLTPRRLAQIATVLGDGVEEAVERTFSGYLAFLPKPKQLLAAGLLRDAVREHGARRGNNNNNNNNARSLVAPVVEEAREKNSMLRIGDAEAPALGLKTPLVPAPEFVSTGAHLWTLRDLLRDWALGRHLLLVGNQGVGKNKLADHLLGLLGWEREYVQLHRDTTVEALTSAPAMRDGRLERRDPALVRAARYGRALVVDEADKAPLEVVCVLKTLLEDGELELADGRRLATISDDDDDDDDRIAVHETFRIVVLANRPGYPFHGNDFYRECGDAFACHAIHDLDELSALHMLRHYAPALETPRIVEIARLFDRLRRRYDDGELAYPYSTREAVKVARHLDAYPGDALDDVLDDVFGFDAHDNALYAKLKRSLLGTTSSQKYTRQLRTDDDDDDNIASEKRRRLLHLARTTEREEKLYAKLWDASVASEVEHLRLALAGRQARAQESAWARLQTHGELDEQRLVDGIAGASNVYKRRARQGTRAIARSGTKKRILFVLDLSGSMYVYNKIDGRLSRTLQCLLLVLEAFGGEFERNYDYAVVAHSGSSPQITLVPWGHGHRLASKPDRLRLVRKMLRHAQTCKSGDNTINATRRAVLEVAKERADEYFVFLLSDADFGRYGVAPQDLAKALTINPKVAAIALFIASNFKTADDIRAQLPPGRAFTCFDTANLVATLRHIFLSATY
ncbi:hypothetical protein CTAYLR_008983 [Chrysophaeum taylorii]|uniref:Midasin n=1 Tax=Chrysophaeum taylorii TaxID=2483200 RepID=A0AAD7U9Q5_9STRA|nr:hypothetical protein CTAYLR_008983 [Chrysophaeum taylorii]